MTLRTSGSDVDVSRFAKPTSPKAGEMGHAARPIYPTYSALGGSSEKRIDLRFKDIRVLEANDLFAKYSSPVV
jgi:hypothetical protein